MTTTILGGLLLTTLALGQQTDTTFDVQADARLRLSNPGGTVLVQTWDRSAVRIQAEHSRRSTIAVRNSPQLVVIEEKTERGPGSLVDYELTVPRTMHLQLEGSYSDFDIRGAGGDVIVESLDGNIKVSGGNGRINLESVHGSLTLSGGQGKIQLETVNDYIDVEDASGEFTAETVNGRIVLKDVDFTSAEATTFNGSIIHDGPIRDGGRYWFASHRGSITVGIPEGTNATVSVASPRGRFTSDFPVEMPENAKSRFEFTLGSGSAVLELESFGGKIHLRRLEGG